MYCLFFKKQKNPSGFFVVFNHYLILLKCFVFCRFGFVQDKYSPSAFNFPGENKPQYIHVTGERAYLGM